MENEIGLDCENLERHAMEFVLFALFFPSVSYREIPFIMSFPFYFQRIRLLSRGLMR